MNKFADRLKDLRMEKQLTQRELAKEVGFSQPAIARWEANLHIPNIDVIIVLCNYFNCTAGYIIGLEN